MVGVLMIALIDDLRDDFGMSDHSDVVRRSSVKFGMLMAPLPDPPCFSYQRFWQPLFRDLSSLVARTAHQPLSKPS